MHPAGVVPCKHAGLQWSRIVSCLGKAALRVINMGVLTNGLSGGFPIHY